jgi:hypothetical protein
VPESSCWCAQKRYYPAGNVSTLTACGALLAAMVKQLVMHTHCWGRWQVVVRQQGSTADPACRHHHALLAAFLRSKENDISTCAALGTRGEGTAALGVTLSAKVPCMSP